MRSWSDHGCTAAGNRYEGHYLGRADFTFNTGDYYRKNILFPFFEQYLKGASDAKPCEGNRL